MEKQLIFNNRPSILVTSFLALLGISNSFSPEDPFPAISADWKNLYLDENHLKRFNSICDIKDDLSISPIYFLTLAYPLIQRILCQKSAPLSMFKVLNTRLQLLQFRPFRKNEPFSIHCHLNRFRVLPKGLEVYIHSLVNTHKQVIWENIQTFYYRGEFSEADKEYKIPGFDAIVDPERLDTWFLPEGIGFAFAGISGDGNPIHYSKAWAKVLGFERDFAQPLSVLANSLDRLNVTGESLSLYLDIILKGPVYYGKRIYLEKQTQLSGARFDVFYEGNQRPSMCGCFETVTEKTRLSEMLAAN